MIATGRLMICNGECRFSLRAAGESAAAFGGPRLRLYCAPHAVPPPQRSPDPAYSLSPVSRRVVTNRQQLPAATGKTSLPVSDFQDRPIIMAGAAPSPPVRQATVLTSANATCCPPLSYRLTQHCRHWGPSAARAQHRLRFAAASPSCMGTIDDRVSSARSTGVPAPPRALAAGQYQQVPKMPWLRRFSNCATNAAPYPVHSRTII